MSTNRHRNWTEIITKPPKTVRRDEHAEYFTIFASSAAGAIIHIALLILFFWQDIIVLAYFNILSVAMWLAAIYINRLGKHAFAIFIGGSEILAHAVVAVSVLGLDYGFQMYIWPVACLVAVNPQVSSRSASFFGVFCLIIFVSLYEIFPNRTGVALFPDHVLLIFAGIVFSGGIPLIIGIMSMKTVFLRQKKKLEKLANCDALTGLHNRRYFYTFLEIQNELAKKNKQPFCVALADIDKFKDINDNLGHDVGDDVLVSVAKFMSASVKDDYDICRWGGEEFLLVLPNTTEKDAFEFIDDLRLKLSNRNMRMSRSLTKKLRVTMSFGLVECDGNEKIDDFVKRADQLLYKAKDAGRNNVQTITKLSENTSLFL